VIATESNPADWDAVKNVTTLQSGMPVSNRVDANGNAPQLHNGIANPTIAAVTSRMHSPDKDGGDDDDDGDVPACSKDETEIDDSKSDNVADMSRPSNTHGAVSESCPTNRLKNFAANEW
jgi:hypothetical protein